MGHDLMGDDDDYEQFLSNLYHVLQARRRREVIRIIHTTDDSTLSVRSIAREIAAVEYDLAQTNATGEPYRNAYNALSQTHLPTLADADIVIYNSERQTVSRGGNLPLAALLVDINEPTIETFRNT